VPALRRATRNNPDSLTPPPGTPAPTGSQTQGAGQQPPEIFTGPQGNIVTGDGKPYLGKMLYLQADQTVTDASGNVVNLAELERAAGFAPPPAPDFYRIGEIVQTLRGSPPTFPEPHPLSVTIAKAPPHLVMEGRMTPKIRAQIAQGLGVPVERVLVASTSRFPFSDRRVFRVIRDRMAPEGGGVEDHFKNPPFPVADHPLEPERLGDRRPMHDAALLGGFDRIGPHPVNIDAGDDGAAGEDWAQPAHPPLYTPSLPRRSSVLPVASATTRWAARAGSSPRACRRKNSRASTTPESSLTCWWNTPTTRSTAVTSTTRLAS